MEEEFEDESMGSEDDSMSDEDVEMEDDQIQIESRELQQALLDEEAKGTAINDIKELWAASNPLIESPQEGISLYTTYIYLLRRMNARKLVLLVAYLQVNFQPSKSLLRSFCKVESVWKESLEITGMKTLLIDATSLISCTQRRNSQNR